MALPGLQNTFRLRQRKCAAVAEYIAKFRQLASRHFGNELVDKKADVFLCSSGLLTELRGHHVRAEKRGNNVEGLFFG